MATLLAALATVAVGCGTGLVWVVCARVVSVLWWVVCARVVGVLWWVVCVCDDSVDYGCVRLSWFVSVKK